MVADILFPFFEIFVGRIFGSIGLSLVALAIVFTLLLSLCRCSWNFILFWMMFYILVMFTFYIGALGMVIMIMIGGIYFFTQIIRLFYPDR